MSENFQDDREVYNEFPEEPNEFTEALEEALFGEGKILDYPETEHPSIEDIIF